MKVKFRTLFILILIVAGIFIIANFQSLLTVFPGVTTAGGPPDTRIVNQQLSTNIKEGDRVFPYSDQCSLDPIVFPSYAVLVPWAVNKYGLSEKDAYNQLCCSKNPSILDSNGDCRWCEKREWRWIDDKWCGYGAFPAEINCDKITAGEHEVESWVAMVGSGCQGGFYYRQRITVAPVPCTYESNQMLAVETFSEGTTVSKTSLKYPVVKFCGAHPPLLVDAVTKLSYTDNNLMDKLDKGESYIIPSGKVMAVYYVINNQADIPVLCETNKAYDISDGMCKDAIGFVTICNQGTWDSSQGLCVVQPQSSIICPENGRYDITQQLCIINPQAECPSGSSFKDGYCIYTPELRTVCPQGSWNEEMNACVVTQDVTYLCLTGELKWVEGKAVCTIIADEKIICPFGFYYKKDMNKCVVEPGWMGFLKAYGIWIGLGIIVLAGLWFMLRRRR